MITHCIAALVPLIAASLAFGAAPHATPESGGCEDLFNGEDLSGWTQVGGNPERRGTFHVEDGAIVGTYVAGTSNTFLATERPFGDFILQFEFMVSDGVNSGVQFRSMVKPQNQRVSGYQFEIDPSARAWSGGVYHEAGRGWLYPLEFNPDAKPLLKVNEWNAGRIECVGTSIRTWINNEPVAHLIDDHAASGLIALQVHGIGGNSPMAGRTVRWRAIQIWADPAMPTPPQDDLFIRNLIPNHLSEAEAQQGWRLLFDGTTTSEWRGTQRTEFPTNGWRVEDGQLIVASRADAPGNDRGDIVTRETFPAFDLQLDVWPTKGANSGIKYYVIEPEGGGALGLEYQILDDKEHPDSARGAAGNRTMASLYDLIPSDRRVNGRDVPRRVDGWNHVRIVAAPDNRVQHWLNGYAVVDYVRGSGIYRALVARSKYKTIDAFGMAEAGHILLQDHSDEVRFRSIKIRPLD